MKEKEFIEEVTALNYIVEDTRVLEDKSKCKCNIKPKDRGKDRCKCKNPIKGLVIYEKLRVGKSYAGHIQGLTQISLAIEDKALLDLLVALARTPKEDR